MNWFYIIVLIIIILQEVQIILLRRDLTDVSDMLIMSLSSKIKKITAYLAEDDEETSGDE